MEDNLNGGRPQWKMTSMEDDLNGRQPKGKNISIEEYLDVSRPQWMDRKQMLLASQFCTELGPAQPQLVILFYSPVPPLSVENSLFSKDKGLQY